MARRKKKTETVLSVVKEIRDHLKSRFPHTPVLKPEAEISREIRFVRNSDGTVIDKQLNLIWYPTLGKKLASDGRFDNLIQVCRLWQC